MSRIITNNLRHNDATADNLTLDGTGNITAPGNLSVTGTSTLTDDLVVDTDTLFVDVSADRVGINRTPGSQLDVQGANCNFRITSNDGNTSCNLQTIESAEVRFGPTTNSDLAIYTNGLERARFLGSNGALQLRNSTGIDFSQIQTNAAGMSSETLDSYEEGTFTPELQVNGSSPGVTYSSRTGQYTKIGRVVYVNIRMQTSNNGTNTGGVRISGLPFTIRSQNFVLKSFPFTASGLSGEVSPWCSINTTLVNLYYGLGTYTAFTDSNWTNNGDMHITGFYYTDT